MRACAARTPTPRARAHRALAELHMCARATSLLRARAQTRRADQAVRRTAAARANTMAAVERRVERTVGTVVSKLDAGAAAQIARAVARAQKAENETAAARAAAEEAHKKERAAEQRACDAERKKDLEVRRVTRALREENTKLRAENFALRVENEKMLAEVAHVRAEAARHIARFGNLWVPRRARGKGAGRGRRHSDKLRKIYMKLLTLYVPPNAINEVFATIAVAICGEHCEQAGMELPDDAFCRGLRMELGAIHRLTCGLAFAKSKRIRCGGRARARMNAGISGLQARGARPRVRARQSTYAQGARV